MLAERLRLGKSPVSESRRAISRSKFRGQARGSSRETAADVKFHLARPDGRNLFTGYGAGFVAVNGTPHRSSVIVMADQVLAWDVGYAGALNEAAFARLAALPVEILLLGTGPSLSFPHPRLTQPLRDAGIGLEVMDTAAACRTYNILLGEDRRVAAALVVTPAGEHTHA
jgi:uncharacterized protein